jgi:hypothetical protein
VTLASSGATVLQQLLEQSVASLPRSCSDDRCEAIVSSSIRDEPGRTLAVCRVIAAGSSFGPPRDCEPIAIRDATEWWLRIVVGQDSAHPYLVPVYQLDVAGLSRESIMAALDHGAADPPLSLQDRNVKGNRLLAIGSKRFSKVLSGGWFEWTEILVELDEEYEVSISLDLLVNKQNTANPADWHLPTDQQVDEYRQVIKSMVARTLSQSCVDPAWTGTKQLRCDQLKTVSGGKVRIPVGASSRPQNLDPRITVRK